MTSSKVEVVRTRNVESPKTLQPLTPILQIGLLPVAIFAMTSLISVTILLVFITRRLLSWRQNHREHIGYNQYVILIFNLLLADLHQSIAFSMSFYWLQVNKISAPSAPCFFQAWFLHLGDLASGFFVLAIAIHTWLGIVKGFKLPYFWFVMSILFTWSLALFLTLLGPLIHRDRFFARAGGWCWVSADFQTERLLLHYLWIFIVEFGTMAIYGHIFFHLRGRIRTIDAHDTTKFSRATKFMVLYPLVYIILTLPIAVGRMIAMTGTNLPDIFLCIAGSFLTSCGWLDAIMYTLTRRVFTDGDSSSVQYGRSRTSTAITTSTRCPSDVDQYDMHTMSSKSPLNTSRSSRASDWHYMNRPSYQPTLLDQRSSRTTSQASFPTSLQKNSSRNTITEINMGVDSPNRSEEFDMVLSEQERIFQEFGRRLR